MPELTTELGDEVGGVLAVSGLDEMVIAVWSDIGGFTFLHGYEEGRGTKKTACIEMLCTNRNEKVLEPSRF